jgi:hypothetical protein
MVGELLSPRRPSLEIDFMGMESDCQGGGIGQCITLVTWSIAPGESIINNDTSERVSQASLFPPSSYSSILQDSFSRIATLLSFLLSIFNSWSGLFLRLFLMQSLLTRIYI